jgi:hypothetical protein
MASRAACQARAFGTSRAIAAFAQCNAFSRLVIASDISRLGGSFSSRGSQLQALVAHRAVRKDLVLGAGRVERAGTASDVVSDADVRWCRASLNQSILGRPVRRTRHQRPRRGRSAARRSAVRARGRRQTTATPIASPPRCPSGPNCRYTACRRSFLAWSRNAANSGAVQNDHRGSTGTNN